MAENTQNQNFQNINIKELENSEVEIEGEISAEKLANARTSVLDKHAKEANIPGFRKGHVPHEMIIKQMGEEPVMHEAAEKALSEEYPKILIQHQVDAIGRPEVSVTKLAEGNPLGFKIKTAISPKFEIKNYKAIAKEEMSKAEESVEPTDEEVKQVIEQVRKQHATSGGGADDEAAPAESAESGSADASTAKEDLPELTDEFVKSIGDFKDVADFKEKIKERLKAEKQREAQEKRRLAVIDRIIQETDIPLPSILVDHELNKMLAQFKDDVARAGMTFEKYLEHVGKSENELREQWRETAVKKAKMQLILNKIAAAEKIEAEREAIDKNVESILAEHKNADAAQVRVYVQTMLTNDKVFRFLEEQGKDS